jgi:lipopolysaccharide/colanic/teichoic acid biosynthesis glycosyltransferase
MAIWAIGNYQRKLKPMKRLLVFLFALVFPVLFIVYFLCAVTWKIIKDCYIFFKKEYVAARKEFYKL